MKKENSDLIFPIAVLLFVLIAGIALVKAPKTAPTSGYVPVDVGGGSIIVEDQESLDKVILSAELVEAGFVTIHESMGAAPARIVGISEYLPIGNHENVVIDLDIPMKGGYKYITILHVDNGDHVYVTNDDLPVMVDGAVVRPDFMAQPEKESIPIPGTDISIPMN